MAEIRLKLNGNCAEICNEFPIILSTDKNILIKIDNYQANHKYTLFINDLSFDFKYDKLELNINYLDKIKNIKLTDNGEIYSINKEKLMAKRVINIGSGDKLNDLLLVLYQQNKELTKRVEELEERVGSGDLLV